METAALNIPVDMMEDLNNEVCQAIENFIIMCRELCIVVKAENELILETGTSVGDENFFRKMALIEAFEKEAQSVFTLVRQHAPKNSWLQLYLVSEIGTLRHIFKINTALHKDDLVRRQERFATLQKDVTVRALNERETRPCH